MAQGYSANHKPIDENYLIEIMNSYKLTVFIEEGMKEGGFGEYTSALALKHNIKTKTAIIAVESSFLQDDIALGTREELLAVTGLDSKGIAETVFKYI